jgi:O-antigen/teichoic acid export membrane protein
MITTDGIQLLSLARPAGSGHPTVHSLFAGVAEGPLLTPIPRLRSRGRRGITSDGLLQAPNRAASIKFVMSEQLNVGVRRVTLDVVIQIVARVANLGLGVVVTLILVRALGSRQFGVWSTLLAITQITSSFGELGLAQIAVSRAASEPEREPEWLGGLLSLRLLIAVPITLVSILAVFLVIAGESDRLAGTLLSLVLLVGAAGALGAVFQLRVRNHVSMLIMTVNSVVWGAGVIVVAALSGGMVAFAAVFLASSALTTVITVFWALRFAAVRLRHAWRLWRPLLRVGLGLGAAGILVTLYVKLDQVLVFEFKGSRQAGLYGADYRLLDQIQFIPISAMTTLFPLIASAFPADRDRVRRLLQTTAEYLAMASFPILAFTLTASHPIIQFLFGNQFDRAAPALPILAGAFVSISFGYLVGNMVVILELQRPFLRYAALGLFINITLNLIFVPRFGFLAAAWITLATEVTVMSLSMRCVVSALEMRPRFGRLARILLAAGFMGATTSIVELAGAPFVAVVAVAGASYVPALFVVGALTTRQIRAALRRGSVERAP